MAEQGKYVWDWIEERVSKKPPRSREIVDVAALSKLVRRDFGPNGLRDARPKEQ